MSNQLACQAEREVRALEVADWMHSEQLLQLAVKYATRARKRQLANRLTDMAEQFVKEAAEETDSLMLDSAQSSFVHDEDAATPPVVEIEGFIDDKSSISN